MGEEVCYYQKFGFSKFKEHCKIKHLIETCKDLSACVDPKKVATKDTLEGAKGMHLKDSVGSGMTVGTTKRKFRLKKTFWK